MQSTSGGAAIRRDRGVLRIVALAAVAALLLLAGVSTPASAEFRVLSFRSELRKADGREESQAGKHPHDMTVSFDLSRKLDSLFGFFEVPDGLMRDFETQLPPGFAGNPTATTTCATQELLKQTPLCPVESQVGIIAIDASNGGEPPATKAYPVFNLKPDYGQVAKFAFNPRTGTPINIVASVRSDSDYGVTATLEDSSVGSPFVGARLTLWGVPGDPAHDAQRGNDFGCDGDPSNPANCTGGGFSTTSPPRAFLTNPTYCGPALTTSARATSWDGGADTARYVTATGPTGCDSLVFEPTIDIAPDSARADAPTGLTVDLDVPQNDNPNGLATPSLRKAVVTLPEGVSLNAPQADGLAGCTDAQVALHSLGPVSCPDASRIGEMTITTPLLAEQLTGSIFLGQPVPGKTFRIFLVAESAARGISIRLEGLLSLDPVTGRVTTTFDDNPPLPFSNLHLHFNGGPRAPLATPQTCGTHTSTAELTPWADPNATPVVVTSSFEISHDGNGVPCPPRGFSPGFSGGLTNPVGGADSSFTMTLTRDDYDHELKSVGVSMPEGLLARIADVPVLCDDALAAAGTCPEGSRVGDVTAASGAGPNPFHLPGRVYITGPYKGGPFGLSIVVPAIAGPFDLGTVVVRAAIHVDRRTTAIDVVSDPLPTIVEGVPLRLRMVNVHINREHFMFAPTDCSPSEVRGTIGSTAGNTVVASSPFQAANCAALPFKPRMLIRVGGRGRTQRGRSTRLSAVVRMTPGQANLQGVKVVLPATINARLPVVNNACTLEEFHARQCEDSRVGTAVAVSPLLRDPLRASVHFVKNGNPLPDLMMLLEGQVDVELAGKVTIPGSTRLATNFDAIPDVPITKFALRLVSGKQGPVGVARNLCSSKGRRARMRMVFRAQNGKVIRSSRRLKIAGCSKAKAAARGGRASRGR